MNFRTFATQVLFRFTVILVTLLLLAYVATATPMRSPLLVLAIFAIGVAVNLFHYINRTNTELARFLNAVRYEDFLQSFSSNHLGTGFPELSSAFKKLIEGFREARSKKEQQARYLETLVEHMPMPLVAVYEGDRIELRNNAARRLFNRPRHVKEEDLEEYGNLFLRDLKQARAGETRVTRINIGGNEQQFIMSTTQITVDGKVQRIMSLVDIQTHLDSTELAAWQDLVRVVSHEILNSVTPIASLARTADEMVEELEVSGENEEKLKDVRNAVQTLARRSEGLTRFVHSYKRLTQMAPPKQARIQLKDYLDRLERLMKAELAGRDIAFVLEEVSGNPQIRADEDLLDQALINLIQNAADALTGIDDPRITVRAWLNERGRAIIEVEDNGPGVSAEIADRIFLPFFSTKQEGSGIGLALTRQIVMVHGGALVLMPDRERGACFRLTL